MLKKNKNASFVVSDSVTPRCPGLVFCAQQVLAVSILQTYGFSETQLCCFSAVFFVRNLSFLDTLSFSLFVLVKFGEMVPSYFVRKMQHLQQIGTQDMDT